MLNIKPLLPRKELQSLLPPTGNLDFELVGHSARAGRMPVHSFKIRTTLESGERVDITERVATELGRKLNSNGALNEGGMGYYKPDVIAGSLAEKLYDQDRYHHTFKVRTEDGVSEGEKRKHDLLVGLRSAVESSNATQVDNFLSKGADPNGRDQHGRTALHMVGDEKITHALIEAGADPRVKDAWGKTPLDTNWFGGPKKIIQAALNREALASVASPRRADLASPEEALARRSRGRSL